MPEVKGDDMGMDTRSLASYVTEERPVSGFNGIRLRGFGQVHLRQTGSESLEVRAPKPWMNRIETRVKDGTLELGFKKRLFPSSRLLLRKPGAIEFTITADVIKSLKISGAGSFDTDPLRARDLYIGVSGAGRITSRGIDADSIHVDTSGSAKMALDRLHADAIRVKSSGVADMELDHVIAKTFSATLNGAGNIKAAGSSHHVEARMSGTGSLSLDGLETAQCQAKISGAGKIRVHANESLETNITGAGSVLYKGNPQLCGRMSGSGHVSHISEE